MSYDPYWDDVYGLWRFEGVDAATSTTDESFQGLATTFAGNAQLDTAQFKFGASSLLLDGTGDYIQVTDASAFNTPLTGDFTVEGWYRFNATGNGGLFHFYPGVPPSTSSGLALGWDGTQWQIYANAGTHAKAGSVSTGQWYHVALVRSSGSIQLYVDGVATGTAVTDSTVYSGNNLHIGLYFSNGFTFNGWVDSFRITDFARYTANFTPPTVDFPTVGADPFWDSVTLLLGQDQPNASTTFTDESPAGNTITPSGNVQYSTADPKFGTSAIEFDGASDYLVSDIVDLLGSGTLDMSFTFDVWINVDSLAAAKGIFGSRALGAQNSGFQFYVNTDGSIGLNVYNNTASAVLSLTTTAGDITVNTWHFVRLTRETGGTWRIGIDGVQEASGTETGNCLHTNGTALWIGNHRAELTSPFWFDGQMEQVRVTNGDARPITELPTVPFPTQPTTDPFWDSVVTLINADDGTITDLSNSAHTVTANGTAAASATQSKWGGRSVSLPAAADAVTLPSNADFTFGTGDYTVEGWFYLSSLSNNAFLDNRLDGAGDLVIYDSNGSAPVAPTLYVNGANRAVGANASTGQWYHIAAARESGTARFFIDGVQQGTDYADATNYTSTQFVVGNTFDYSFSLRGYVDDFRITKGVARYTSNFTAPTGPFPAQGPDAVGIATFTEQLQIQSSPATVIKPIDAGPEQLQIQELAAAIAGTAPAAPQLTGPNNVSVTEGEEAVFTVAAVGFPTLTYQWYKDGVALTGETSEQLFYDALFEDNGSTFYVVVTDGIGQSTQSATVTLTVAEQTGNRMALVWNYEDDNYTWMDASVEQGIPAAQLPIECQPYDCDAFDTYLLNNSVEWWPMTEATDSPPTVLTPNRKSVGSTYDLYDFAGNTDFVEGSVGPTSAARTGLDTCNPPADELRNRYNFLGRPDNFHLKVYAQGTTNFVQDPTGPIDWSYHVIGGVDGWGLLWRKTCTGGGVTGGKFGFQLDTLQGANSLDWYCTLSGDPADSLLIKWPLDNFDTTGDWLITTTMQYTGVSEQQVNVAFPAQGAMCMEFTGQVYVNGTLLYDGILYAPFESTTFGNGSLNDDPTVMSVTNYEMFRAMNITVGSVYRGVNHSTLWTAFQRNFTDYQRPSYCALLDQELVGTVAMDYGFDPGWQVRWSDLSATSWNDLSSTSTRWSDFYSQGQEQNLYYLTPSGLWKADQVVKTDGLKQYYVEREGIDLDDLVTDWTTNKWKHIRQFYFHLESDLPAGTTAPNNFDMTVGWAKNLMDTPDWETPVTVNLQSTTNSGEYKVDFRTTGRYLSLRFDFDDTGELVMTGGDIDAVESHGR